MKLADEGHIINVASIAGLNGVANFAARGCSPNDLANLRDSSQLFCGRFGVPSTPSKRQKIGSSTSKNSLLPFQRQSVFL
ncbi:MAG: hypothetical protein O2829_00135 [Bacteroidetes bacterium]|nr:hypothetical protein [Bacteroidota bacterium]